MTRPAASIVTTAHRTPAPLLRICVDSLLDQTMSDLELVLVIDGAGDGLDAEAEAEVERAAEDPRVVVLRPGRVGRPAALNVGVAAASADLVGIQDADDASHPTRLEHQVDLMRAHPEVGVLGTGARVLRSSTAAADWSLGDERPSLRVLDRELYRSNPLIHSSMLCRADAVRSVGGYDERRVAQVDYDLLLRLRAIGTVIGVCDLPLVLHRRHPAQNFEGMAPWSRAVGSYRLQRAHLSDLPGGVAVTYHGLAAARLAYQVGRSVVWHRLARRPSPARPTTAPTQPPEYARP